MSEDDGLFGYRLQLFDYAARTTVSEACRPFGVHRSTFYRWKAQVDRHCRGEMSRHCRHIPEAVQLKALDWP